MIPAVYANSVSVITASVMIFPVKRQISVEESVATLLGYMKLLVNVRAVAKGREHGGPCT